MPEKIVCKYMQCGISLAVGDEFGCHGVGTLRSLLVRRSWYSSRTGWRKSGAKRQSLDDKSHFHEKH